jgi:hypothetical protein
MNAIQENSSASMPALLQDHCKPPPAFCVSAAPHTLVQPTILGWMVCPKIRIGCRLTLARDEPSLPAAFRSSLLCEPLARLSSDFLTAANLALRYRSSIAFGFDMFTESRGPDLLGMRSTAMVPSFEMLILCVDAARQPHTSRQGSAREAPLVIAAAPPVRAATGPTICRPPDASRWRTRAGPQLQKQTPCWSSLASRPPGVSGLTALPPRAPLS